MAYTKQTWADLPSKTTPINATRLGHIEDGIFNAAQTADTAASTAGTAAANVGILSGKVATLEGQMYDVLDNLDDKVDKVAGKGLSTNDYDDTDKGKVDSLGTASTKNSTSVVTDSSDLVESVAVKDIVGWGNKNSLEVKASSGSIRQVVFTINSDKTITANGTATGGNASFTINDDVDIKAGAYILSGGINSNKLLVLTAWNGGAYVKNIAQAPDAPVKFTIDFDGYDKVQASLFVRSDVTANDTFYPMISKDGGAYEPYHASVEESKADNSVIGTVEGANASKAWSVGEHFINDGQFKEVTQAIASGGAINDSNTTDKPIAELLNVIDITSDFLNGDLPTGVTLGSSSKIYKIGHLIIGNIVVKNSNGFSADNQTNISIKGIYSPAVSVNSYCYMADDEWGTVTDKDFGYFYAGSSVLGFRKLDSTKTLTVAKVSFVYVV